MQNRNSLLFAVLILISGVAFADAQYSQTVDQLMASDASQAAANEKAAAEKAEKAAREAAGLPPPGVVAAEPVKQVHHRVFELVSILGINGQRKVVFKVDGKQIELNEPGGESNGYKLVDVDGTCAVVGDVRTYRYVRGHKHEVRTSTRATHNVCYVPPIPFMSESMGTGMGIGMRGLGGSLPAPIPLNDLRPAPIKAPTFPPEMAHPAGVPASPPQLGAPTPPSAAAAAMAPKAKQPE
ncbi:MAG: hypothetical protein EPN64_04560 [Burkholderiaceae bacterium]|nr:MAG: hypothetical protein EPN64_04560 [Burkholderiaceae bacterium]